MRILVCGGRDWSERERTFAILDHLLATRGITAIIHGAARGADSLAGEWARARGIEEIACPADWTRYGRSAGFRRNAEMLTAHAPAAVVAFPGGRGTADMIARSRDAGLPVWEACR